MTVPYRFRGVSLLILLCVGLPWSTWHFALYDTVTAWWECRAMEREMESLGSVPEMVTDSAVFRENPELILSGKILDSLRCYVATDIHILSYVPFTSVKDAGVEINTAKVAITGSFIDLVKLLYRLEHCIPYCPIISMVWELKQQMRTRQEYLVLNFYMQQLQLISE